MLIKNLRLLLLLIALVPVQAQDGITPADWPSYGGTQASWRYSGLNQVNRGMLTFNSSLRRCSWKASPLACTDCMMIGVALCAN